MIEKAGPGLVRFSGVARLQSRKGKGVEMGQISTDRKRAGQGVPRQEA